MSLKGACLDPSESARFKDRIHVLVAQAVKLRAEFRNIRANRRIQRVDVGLSMPEVPVRADQANHVDLFAILDFPDFRHALDRIDQAKHIDRLLKGIWCQLPH